MQPIQKDTIPVWSPSAQIKAALSQTPPDLYQQEILDAISEFPLDNAAPRPALLESLRTTPWLALDDIAVAPNQLLALPPEVDNAAEPNLAVSSTYISVGRLPARVRMHPAFRYVQDELVPDRRCSLARLERMIAAVGLQGRLGAAEDLPFDQFTELARMGADLTLPGWPLLAAILSSINDEPNSVRNVARSFPKVSDTEPEMAGTYLDALAELADRDSAHRVAAKRVYHHGFKAVAKWNFDARQRVFGYTRVPTKNGGWRCAKEVLIEDNGVVPEHVPCARVCVDTSLSYRRCVVSE